ncbi:MAG: hypothetical protein ACF8XB_02330, partial [Planctomycetota bacterium JB042]
MTERDDDDARDDEDDPIGEEPRGRILRFPRPAPRRPVGAGWVTPDDVDRDEAHAYLHALVLRHVDPRIAEELVPLLSDPGERETARTALAAVVPPSAMAQTLAHVALATPGRGRRLEVAHAALALDDENLDARVVRTVLTDGDDDERLAAVAGALEAARGRERAEARPDALEPVFARVRAAAWARARTVESRLLLALGRDDEALAAAEDALRAGGPLPGAAVAAAAARLCAGDGPAAARALATVEGDDVDAAARWGLALAWRLAGDSDRALDHLALARREAPNVEVRLVRDAAAGLDADDPLSGVIVAWTRHADARAWLLGQTEPLEPEAAAALRLDTPLPRDEDGRLDEDAAEAYGETLVRRFLVSDEARRHLAAGGSTALPQWAL